MVSLAAIAALILNIVDYTGTKILNSKSQHNDE